MSNNAPDYENDLVFPPQEIKSQDYLTTAGSRQSDVLIKAIEKCEKLEKQLKIALNCINEYCRSGCNPLAQKTKKQIEELDK